MSLVMAMSTLHFLLLLLSSMALIFDKRHATETNSSSNPSSLVLSLTHYSPNKNTSEILDNINTPLKEKSDRFMMALTLGTPPQVIQNVHFDTASELVWVPCRIRNFQCIDCDAHQFDISSFFSPAASNTLEREFCSSPLCVDLHSSESSNDTCAMAGCTLRSILYDTCIYPCPSFAYSYAGGVVAGDLGKDILRAFGDNSPNLNISFGCVRATLKQPYGIAGFGKGPLSLPSQLGFSEKGFYHCLLPFNYSGNTNFSSPLILGDRSISSKDNFQFTSMLENPLNSLVYYYIGLTAITVGNLTPIQAPSSLSKFDRSGNGGMIIDSGATYTHLPDAYLKDLINDLDSIIKYPRDKDVEERTEFDLCYRFPMNGAIIPSITFNFSGDVNLTLPQGTYFYKMARPNDSGQQTNCLLFRNMGDAADSGPAGVFGSFQQQNVEVVYDLKNQRIGFQPADCLALAKSHGLNK